LLCSRRVKPCERRGQEPPAGHRLHGLATAIQVPTTWRARIARRTSGGRGEYEISEDFDGLTPRDLFERAITLTLSDGWAFATRTRLREQGGKRRLRRIEPVIHLHRQLAACPHDAHTSPRPRGVWRWSARPARGRLRDREHPPRPRQAGRRQRGPTRIEDVLVENGDHHEEPIDYAGRLEAIRFIWDSVDDLPPELGNLVSRYRALVTTGGPIPSEAEDLIAELQR
jgi:hypothetical protein